MAELLLLGLHNDTLCRARIGRTRCICEQALYRVSFTWVCTLEHGTIASRRHWWRCITRSRQVLLWF